MNERFYPDFFPSFPYEPLRSNFKIIETNEKGEGVISLRKFNNNEPVFSFTGIILNEQTLFTLQYTSSAFIHDPFFMGKILHSCDPNMICDMENRIFTACKEINPEDYLTMDYETTEDILFRPFFCSCQSEYCRGWIRGKTVNNEIIPEKQPYNPIIYNYPQPL